ncbi:MAG: hypothetical protein HDKAJFGB_01056 [Anaerolineae bacterium]|nr:hypothetical protein [Anaerolineae bacterium]
MYQIVITDGKDGKEIAAFIAPRRERVQILRHAFFDCRERLLDPLVCQFQNHARGNVERERMKATAFEQPRGGVRFGIHAFARQRRFQQCARLRFIHRFQMKHRVGGNEMRNFGQAAGQERGAGGGRHEFLKQRHIVRAHVVKNEQITALSQIRGEFVNVSLIIRVRRQRAAHRARGIVQRRFGRFVVAVNPKRFFKLRAQFIADLNREFRFAHAARSIHAHNRRDAVARKQSFAHLVFNPALNIDGRDMLRHIVARRGRRRRDNRWRINRDLAVTNHDFVTHLNATSDDIAIGIQNTTTHIYAASRL